MKKSEQLQKLKELDVDTLTKQLVETEKELMGLRFKKSSGQLEKTGQIKELRKKIARIKTIIRASDVSPAGIPAQS